MYDSTYDQEKTCVSLCPWVSEVMFSGEELALVRGRLLVFHMFYFLVASNLEHLGSVDKPSTFSAQTRKLAL